MTGWTWDQCRALDLPRVDALRAAWRDNPPLAITMRMAAEAMGARFDGAGKPNAAPAVETTRGEQADPHALMVALGQSEPVPYVAPKKGIALPTDGG